MVRLHSSVSIWLHRHFAVQAGYNVASQDTSIGLPTNVLVNDQANEQNPMKVKKHAGKTFGLRARTEIALSFQEYDSRFYNFDQTLIDVADIAADVLVLLTDHSLSDRMLPGVLVDFAKA